MARDLEEAEEELERVKVINHIVLKSDNSVTRRAAVVAFIIPFVIRLIPAFLALFLISVTMRAKY